MNYTGRLLKTLIPGLALFGAAFLTQPLISQDSQPGKAEVRAIRGTAQVAVRQGEEFTPLKVGTVLRGGAVVRTGPESNVDLFLGRNGPVVRVTSMTTLSLDKLTFSDMGNGETVIDTQLNLRAGRILGHVNKMASSSKYEVKTPSGIAGIRGTEYDISHDGTITVITGVVIFAFIDPNSGVISTVTVREGETFRPGGAVKPASPEILKAIDEAIEQAKKANPAGPGDESPTVVVVEEEPFVSSTTGNDAGN